MKPAKITSFFTPKTSVVQAEKNIESPPSKRTKDDQTDNPEPNRLLELHGPNNDVYKFCRRKLDDAEMYEVLVNVWTPGASYAFPVTEINKKKLKFQRSWLEKFTWLAYSGFKNWKRALDKFKEHQTKKYHNDALTDAQNFKLVYEKKQEGIRSEIDKSRKRLQTENRQKLTPIIRAVLFCCRQGIALRGHRDDGNLSHDTPRENDGNFRALLRFALESGDSTLKMHLDTATANATYLSHNIQNQIIEAGAEIVIKKIVKCVNEMKCFTVIADETTDISEIEQFSIGVRYVQNIAGKHFIKEDFLCFVPVMDVTGAGLANTLLETLQKLGLDIDFMRGQGYDGARAMSGKLKGCAAIVQQTCSQAPYLHCANHNLNLAITHACDIPPIRNCMGTVKTVVKFFRQSNKAANLLKAHIVASHLRAKQTRLLKFCETRWVEHLASLSLFLDVLVCICSALEEMDDLKLRFDGVQPNELMASVRTPQFIIALTILNPIFRLTKSLSKNLQKENCDLSQCVLYAMNALDEVKDIRVKADDNFVDIFNSATQIAESIGMEITVPRRVGRQTNRDNYDGNPEEYYRRSIFIPFLDKYVEELGSRFLEHRELLSKVQNIIPVKCAVLDELELKETVHVFKREWPNATETTYELEADMKLWKRFCSNIAEKDRPRTFVEAMDICNRTFYKQIYNILLIGAALPVTLLQAKYRFQLKATKNLSTKQDWRGKAKWLSSDEHSRETWRLLLMKY